jgi:glycosyltransferase involved in cell wall biosynthesis
MKIAHVCPFFKPVVCGVGTVVYELARQQILKGHEVHVFTSDFNKIKSTGEAQEIIDGIKVHRCKHVLRFGQFATFWPSVYAKLVGGKFDIVHSHNFGHPHVILAGLAARKLGVKHIHSTHLPWTARRSAISKYVVDFYYAVYGSIFNSITDRVLILAPQEKIYLNKFGIGKAEVLPNGVNRKFFSTKTIKKEATKILFLGRLSPTKGPDLFVKAAIKLSEKYSNTEFLLAGPDEGLRKELERAAKGQMNIKILGEVSEKQKLNLLKNSDTFVLPSRREGLPLTLLEAMASSCPIIAAPVDGVKSVFRDNINGLFFKPGDSNDLARVMEHMIDSEAKRKKFSKNNFMRAKDFLWETIADKLERIYEND